MAIKNGAAEVERLLADALAFHKSGLLESAERLYQDVLREHPQNAPATHFLGMLAHSAGRQEEAIGLIQRSIQLSPATASFRANLGTVYGKLNRTREAIECFRDTVRLDPKSPEAHVNLGLMLEEAAEFDDAVAAFERAMQLSPTDGLKAHRARALAKAGRAPAAPRLVGDARADGAWTASLKAISYVYERAGRLDDAIFTQRKLLSIRPDLPAAHSTLLFLLLHQSGLTGDELFAEHREWARRHAGHVACSAARAQPPSMIPDQSPDRGRQSGDSAPGRKLRVGYVSPQFGRYGVTRMVEPLIARHDRSQFTVVCFSDVDRPDDVTRRVRAEADVWHDTSGLTDDQFFDLVRSERIDILVDLAGHMYRNRLMAFARRAAPVQLTYMYPHSTAVPNMDGRLTDAYCDPPGIAERFHTEQVVRIPECGWVYRPMDVLPPVNGLPSLATGYVTFGSLNRLVKVTPQMIETWAALLQAVPRSRLMMMAEDERGCERARESFRQLRVKRERIVAVPRCSHHDYLELMHRIDIALDTFPYNGMNTTADALLMGLPVVTLAGETSVSRTGLGVLSNPELPNLVATTPEQYVRIASDLAADKDRLVGLRSTLRERVRSSPLFDEKRLVNRVEHAYYELWRILG